MDSGQRLLIVDDNKKYKELIVSLYQNQDYSVDWVTSARIAQDKLAEMGINHYQAIVTDITMENQTSGLFFAINLRKRGFAGELTIASTGFDFAVVLRLAQLTLGLLGIDYLIPKASLKKGQPKIKRCFTR